MVRAIVSGGAGFLGSHLIDRLLARSDVTLIVVVDDLWTGSIENLAHIRDSRLAVQVEKIENFACDVKFDEVYHFASAASPRHYSAEPARTISANVLGAFRLRELLAKGGRFCFASTSEVYGDPLVSPQPESYRGSVDCTGPRSSYDEAKRCTEAFLLECHRVHGMDVRVARIFNTYGPRTLESDGRAISNFVCRALRGRPISVHGDGAQSRSWGYVDDTIEGLERFFWRDDHNYAGPLNIGNDREASVLEVASYVQSLVPGSRIEFAPPMPQDPRHRCPDLALAKQVIPGWTCLVDYETGIRSTVEWFARRIAAEAAR